MHMSDEKIPAVSSGPQVNIEGDVVCLNPNGDVCSRGMLPYVPPQRQERSGLLIDCLFLPSGSNACDFLDFFLLGESRLGVLMADFSGKPDQDCLSLVKLALRSKSIGRSAAGALRDLDQRLAESSANCRAATAVYLIFDQNTRLLHYASAGHLPVLLHRPAQNKTFLLTAPGAPFGRDWDGDGVDAGASAINRIKGETVALRQGDLILLYSSGLVDQLSADGECFGRQRLNDFLRKYGELNPSSLLVELQRQLETFADAQPHKEEVALVAAKNLVRDPKRPQAEQSEYDISGRFMCAEEEQIILATLQAEPNVSVAQIVSDVTARGLSHLSSHQLQSYLMQTRGWRAYGRGTKNRPGQNGTRMLPGERESVLPSTAAFPKAAGAGKQLQQDLLAAFPARQVLHKRFEFHGQNTLMARSTECYKSGDYQGALFEFSRVRERLTNSAVVYCFSGNLYLLLNKVAKAKQEYLLALKCEQRNAHAHLALSYVALLQEDYYAAIDELSTALRLDENLRPYSSFLQKLIPVVEKREKNSGWLT